MDKKPKRVLFTPWEKTFSLGFGEAGDTRPGICKPYLRYCRQKDGLDLNSNSIERRRKRGVKRWTKPQEEYSAT
jgi:hypothetical protein